MESASYCDGYPIQAPLKYFDNNFYASTSYRNMADEEINLTCI